MSNLVSIFLPNNRCRKVLNYFVFDTVQMNESYLSYKYDVNIILGQNFKIVMISCTRLPIWGNFKSPNRFPI